MSAESVPIFAFMTPATFSTSTGAGLFGMPKQVLDQGGLRSAHLNPLVANPQQGLLYGVRLLPAERTVPASLIEFGASGRAESRTDRGIVSGTIRTTGEDRIFVTSLAGSMGGSALPDDDFGYANSGEAAAPAAEPPLNFYGVEAPSALAYLEPPIRKSRSMLQLGVDWDGEGSPGYDESTWRRALCFLVTATAAFWESERFLPPLPRIGKGPSGSIDIHWLTDDRELLLNVPPDDRPAAFFGDDLGGQQREIEGRIPQGQVGRWLLEWLTT